MAIKIFQYLIIKPQRRFSGPWTGKIEKQQKLSKIWEK